MSDTPQPEAAKLPSSYDTCLLGVTVSIHGQDRFVYSLKKLIGFTMLEHQCQAPEARQIILASFIKPLAREHGPDGPVFVNDEIMLGEVEEEKSVIITPPQFNGRGRK